MRERDRNSIAGDYPDMFSALCSFFFLIIPRVFFARKMRSWFVRMRAGLLGIGIDIDIDMLLGWFGRGGVCQGVVDRFGRRGGSVGRPAG